MTTFITYNLCVCLPRNWLYRKWEIIICKRFNSLNISIRKSCCYKSFWQLPPFYVCCSVQSHCQNRICWMISLTSVTIPCSFLLGYFCKTIILLVVMIEGFCSTQNVLEIITKYHSTLYIGMDEVLAHYACTFENSDLHFHFQLLTPQDDS